MNIGNNQKKINQYYTFLPNAFHEYLISLSSIEQSRKNIFENLNIRSNHRIIEVACGTGINLEYYPEGPSYCAVDINHSMLSGAKKRFKKTFQKKLNVSFQIGNAHKLPFEDNYFDIAIITFGLSAIPDNSHALSEIERVVLNNGKIGLLDFTKAVHSPRFGGQEGINLQKLVNDSRLEVIYEKSSAIYETFSTKSEYILRV